MCIFLGYVCENNSTHLKNYSDAIFDAICSILAILGSGEQNDHIRLAAYRTLNAWLKHLKPTFETTSQQDKLKEILRFQTDNRDILNAIRDCYQSYVEIFEQMSGSSGSKTQKRRRSEGSSVSMSPSPEGSSESKPPTPTPRNEDGTPLYLSSNASNRYLKSILNRKRKIPSSLYKKSLLNAAKNSSNRQIY